ncbi:hypothetical protein AYI69_g3927 [Smittium culicis]|uniref:Velvet domain-containing protein n=1 Tax=Smittium culicis TaxID=133412 RepID=A0A1R1YIP7_9FUNG|nr:hypothetical protein AYI69_g3927 [Smittium culicis]
MGPNLDLVILQQPKRACVVEAGERYRRPIDPPPIIKLIMDISDEDLYSEFVNTNVLAVHTNLLLQDSNENIDNITNLPSTSSSMNTFLKREGRILTGSLTSSSSLVKGLGSKRECYFAFPDLYVGVEGIYRLKFSLVAIQSPIEKNTVSAVVYSEPFEVFSMSEFPGVEESSILSKTLAEQGVGIPIRNKSRLRK